jgi:hypothetical protein
MYGGRTRHRAAVKQFGLAGVYGDYGDTTMTERPGLGYSDMSKSGITTTTGEKLRRVACVIAALAVIAAVFYYLTRAVQTSTAHATGDSSSFHTD